MRKHKALFNALLAAALVLGAAACGEKEDPDKGGSKSTDPTLAELTDATINGTAIDAASNVAGLISNSKTGKGIAGVNVTDGYTWTTTDANGVYQMKRDPRARKIYYTTPAEYEVVLSSESHLPTFFSPGILESGKKYRADFQLTALAAKEEEVTFFMIGDPQCYQISESARYRLETIKDIKAQAGKYKSVYALTLGDITFDATNMWTTMAQTMSNVTDEYGRYIPFFQCIGNHDHNSLSTDSSDDKVDDYNATAKYVETFGPTDYSFDRGDVHVVVMDDIPVSALESSSKPNGKTWNYNAGLTDEQYAWLKKDIENVKGKEGKMVFFCAHIPVRGGSSSGGSSFNTSRHYNDLLTLLQGFKEAHIMIGHTHYQQNYIHSRTAKGGANIYEHIHGAACGAWWTADCSVTGSPNGYSIYNVKGANITNWHLKGSNKPDNYQMRVYDGSQTYTGTKGYKYNWYSTSITYASCTAKGFTEAKDAFVAEVFDDDKQNWTVEFYQNGSKVGDFKRKADGGVANIAVCAFWFNQHAKSTTTWTSTTASHYWYFKPASGKPSAETNWEVKATFKVPTNPSQVNTYTVNKPNEPLNSRALPVRTPSN